MPVKLRSFHQLRYQEMKKFKQLVTLQREDGTQSKQQLNKCAEDDSTSPRHSTRNTSKVTLEAVAEKDEAVERMLEVIKEDSDADNTKQQPQEEISKRNGSKEAKSEGEDQEQDDDEEEDDVADKADNCRFISNRDGPGSPSFRVYCIPSSVNTEDEGSDDTCIFDDGSNHLDDSDEQASHQRTLSWDDESHISTDNSDEVTEANGKKQKRKKFVRAIKGRPFSVRNLLNVKKIYYQSNKFRSISNPNN